MREDNELLVWSSLERNESLPQTKLHFERDMLFIDSDPEDADNGRGAYAGARAGGDDSCGSGSIEWEETVEWDSEDERRMKAGISYGPSGWWDAKVHGSAEERMESERMEKERAAWSAGKVKVKRGEEELPPVRSPHRSRRKSGGYSSGGGGSGIPGRRKSGGKKAFGAGGSSQG
jgi:hypothetical protein